MIRLVSALVLLFCAGCTSFDNPIVSEHGPRFDGALTGSWAGTGSDGSIKVEIRPEGDEGLAIVDTTDPEGETEHALLRLITARLDRMTYGSVKETGRPEDSWVLFQYEVQGDRLIIRADNESFWSGAVRNKIVSGTIATKDLGQSVTVTASEKEMRAVVLGYGSVIFDIEPRIELQRVTTPSRP